jgi:hypothetical protein
MVSENFNELVIRTENGKKIFRVQARELPNWYGIPDIGFIYHNEWSDAEIEYKGEIFNSHDAEDAMWERCCEELGEAEADKQFDKYMLEHAWEVRELLDDILTERKGNYVH